MSLGDEKAPCPICRQLAVHARAGHRVHGFECPRCGDFTASEDTLRELGGDRPGWWYRLSAWVRAKKERGEPYPRIEGTREEIAAWLPKPTITQQLDDLLRLVADRMTKLGDLVRLDLEATAPLVWVQDGSEVKVLLNSLRDLGRIDPEVGGRHGTPGKVRLVTGGLLRLEELEKSAVLNDRVFVAMWFDDSLVPARDAICKAIDAVGYRAHVLSLESAHGDRIDAKILVDIRGSRGLVVDATGPLLQNGKPCPRPSVMYEGGFAEGFEKPVIWTVRADQVDHLPFDTRQLFHLTWESPEDLAEKLRPAIEARFGIRKRSPQ